MHTSLRLGGDSKSLWPTSDSKSHRLGGDFKSLRLHAKEKIPIDSNTRLQVQGELDTRIGAPVFVSALIRHFYPDISASLGVGLQYDKSRKLQYSVRGKKAFPVTTDGLWSFNIKGRCDVDKEFYQWKSRGAAELTWSILNFQKDQDVRLKVGMEVSDKVVDTEVHSGPYILWSHPDSPESLLPCLLSVVHNQRAARSEELIQSERDNWVGSELERSRTRSTRPMMLR